MTPGNSKQAVPGDGLLRPIPLVALIVLALNDHVLKTAWPGVVTGKLSDIAGLAFFPLLLQALWEQGLVVASRPWGPSRRALVVATLATMFVFALAKTWAPANELVRDAAGGLSWPFRAAWACWHGVALPRAGRPVLVRDPTDLLTLPALLLAWWSRRM